MTFLSFSYSVDIDELNCLSFHLYEFQFESNSLSVTVEPLSTQQGSEENARTVWCSQPVSWLCSTTMLKGRKLEGHIYNSLKWGLIFQFVSLCIISLKSSDSSVTLFHSLDSGTLSQAVDITIGQCSIILVEVKLLCVTTSYACDVSFVFWLSP